MRESLEITYHCDAGNCYAKTRVWEENRKWLGRDLEFRGVFLRECGLPLPPTWTTIGDQHFCPKHNITIHGEVPVGEDVEITRTGGFHMPVHEKKE